MSRWLAPAVAVLAVVIGVILVVGSTAGNEPQATDALGSAAGDEGPADQASGDPGEPGDGASGPGVTVATDQDAETDTGADEGDGPVISSPASSTGSTTSIEITDVTVEPDVTTPDPEPGSDDGETGTDGASDETVPTVPAATSGTCAVTMADLDGRSGPVEPASGGACDAVGLTIQAVNPRNDLASVDWGREIRICQRHPAATAIGVDVTSASGTTDLADGLSRAPDEAAADPIASITIRFDGQATPLTGPRPIASCRTAEAELSIVHRPVS